MTLNDHFRTVDSMARVENRKVSGNHSVPTSDGISEEESRNVRGPIHQNSGPCIPSGDTSTLAGYDNEGWTTVTRKHKKLIDKAKIPVHYTPQVQKDFELLANMPHEYDMRRANTRSKHKVKHQAFWHKKEPEPLPFGHGFVNSISNQIGLFGSVMSEFSEI